MHSEVLIRSNPKEKALAPLNRLDALARSDIPPKLTRVRSTPEERSDASEVATSDLKLQQTGLEKVRRLPQRTSSMPKRTIWKDKGGSARYILREEPKPEEIKPPSWNEVAKERLADAVISGADAGLAVFDAVTNTKERLQRSISSNRIVRTLSHSGEPPQAGAANATWGQVVANTKQRMQRSMSSSRMIRSLSRDQPEDEKASANATWGARAEQETSSGSRSERSSLLKAKMAKLANTVDVSPAMRTTAEALDRNGVVTTAA